MGRERMISMKLVAVQDGTAIVDLNMLVSASETENRRLRLRPGECLNVAFDMTFFGDRVPYIDSETDNALIRAKRHEHS